jgi:hypothetical protein
MTADAWLTNRRTTVSDQDRTIPEPDDCYACGDGIEYVGDTWEHINDSIGVDGKRIVSTCDWGKPWARTIPERLDAAQSAEEFGGVMRDLFAGLAAAKDAEEDEQRLGWRTW